LFVCSFNDCRSQEKVYHDGIIQDLSSFFHCCISSSIDCSRATTEGFIFIPPSLEATTPPSLVHRISSHLLSSYLISSLHVATTREPNTTRCNTIRYNVIQPACMKCNSFSAIRRSKQNHRFPAAF
jgi:hypothetical protein